MKEGLITDPYVIDRAQILDHTSRQMERVNRLLEKSKGKATSTSSIAHNGELEKVTITPQMGFGVWLVRRSLMHELADVGEDKMAENIVFDAKHISSR